MLFILSPLRDLMDTELKAITDFTEAGGSVFITCDYADAIEAMPNFSTLYRFYGFVPKTGIVVAGKDEPATYYDTMQIFLLPEMASTDLTYDLIAAKSDLLLLTGARAFDTPDTTDRNLTVQTVLTSGKTAYLRDVNSEELSLAQEPDDETGPFALALQAQRITASGFVSKAFILGSSPVVTDSQVQSMTDSQEFIMTVVSWLRGSDPADIGITPKTAIRPQLSASALTLGSIVIVLLPLLVLSAALIVLLPHRRR